MRRLYILNFFFCTFLIVPTGVAAEDVPAALIRVPDTVATVFVAETSTAQFHRFVVEDGEWVLAGSNYMSIGEKGPGKESSGDKRTPIGVYFVTEQLDTSRLHEKYGVTAFPLDYPNEWDRLAERDGDGIWVHGVHRDGGQRPERDTDGCIALPNEDLLTLSPLFRDNVTPVVVTREMSWGDAAKIAVLRQELEARIAVWTKSQVNGDLHAYFNLYDSEFRRWGMNKREWSSVVLQTGGLQPANIEVTDVLLLGYPGEDALYMSRFAKSTVDAGQKTTLNTRLFWRRDKRGELKIVAEDAG